MSLPVANIWTPLLSLQSILDADTQLEKRMINSNSGQVQYIGYCQKPSGSTSEAIWFIVKCSYDSNGFLNYYQLPNSGAGFIYVWDDTTIYF